MDGTRRRGHGERGARREQRARGDALESTGGDCRIAETDTLSTRRAETSSAERAFGHDIAYPWRTAAFAYKHGYETSVQLRGHLTHPLVDLDETQARRQNVQIWQLIHLVEHPRGDVAVTVIDADHVRLGEVQVAGQTVP